MIIGIGIGHIYIDNGLDALITHINKGRISKTLSKFA